MALTDVVLRKAKPTAQPYKLGDAEGMYLDVRPNGSKYWRLRYRYLGKQKLLALGIYPQVPLAEAREKRQEARRLLAEGKDPSEIRKEPKLALTINAENTFKAIAHEWLEAHKAAWTPRHAGFVLKRLEKDIFPKLGNRPIKDITANISQF